MVGYKKPDHNGTDYPMATSDFGPVRKIMALSLGDEEGRQVLGANAARALNIPD